MTGRLPFFGLLFFAILFSWCGLVQWPADQAQALVPSHPELRDGKIVQVAPAFSDDDARARKAYRRQGCFVCHARQLGAGDLAYGWGARRTGAGEWNAFGIVPEGAEGIVGFARLGPDLTRFSGRKTEEELKVFLKTHYGADDSLAAWLLRGEPKEKKP